MKILLTLFLFNISILTTNAQGDTGNDPDFPDVPLDGGLSLLLAAGVGFAGKMSFDYLKKGKDQVNS
jgi:hypothetical protein